MTPEAEEFLGKLQALCAEYDISIGADGCCTYGECVQFWQDRDDGSDPIEPMFSSFGRFGGTPKSATSWDPISFLPEEPS